MDASGRPAVRLVAVGEDPPIAGREAIARRHAARRAARHREAVAQIDRRGVQLPHRTAAVGRAGQRPGCVAEPPVPRGVLEERATAGPVGVAVGGEEGCRRLAARAERSGARGQRLVVARGGEVAAREQQVVGTRSERHLGVVRRVLPGQRRLVDGQQDGRGSDDACSTGTQLRRPDLRGRRRASAVIGLPDEVGRPGRRIDEGARVENSHARRAAVQRSRGGVREHGRTERPRGGDRDAAVPRILGIGGHRGVVEHDPVPPVEEDAGRGLGVDRFPRRWAGQGARSRATRVGLPARCRAARRVGQGLNEVARRGSRGEGVVDPTRVEDIGVRRVTRIGRRETGVECQVSRQLLGGRTARLGHCTAAEGKRTDQRHQTETADQEHRHSGP